MTLVLQISGVKSCGDFVKEHTDFFSENLIIKRKLGQIPNHDEL